MERKDRSLLLGFVIMMDAFDGIIIGGGYNALTLGAYLAKAGMKLLILERRVSYGGATITEESTLPGFYHNLHANFIWSFGPPYKDLALEKYGVRIVHSPVERAFMFDGGRSLITYTDNSKKSFKSFAKFSEKDAKAIEKVYKKFHETWETEFYSPPKPPAERLKALSKILTPADRDEYLHYCEMTPRQVVEELYESEEIKTWMCVNLCVRGTTDFYEGTGEFILRYASSPRMGIYAGGAHQMAHGLASVFIENGGLILNQSHVEKIMIEDGTATGVVLANGKKFEAKKFVASSVDPPQTFLKLVGEEHLESKIINRVKDWKIEDYNALFGMHLALDEAPKFRSEYDPEVNDAICYFYGYSSLRDLDTHWAEIKSGKLPSKPAGNSCCHSRHDPSYAPPGKHTFHFWQFSPSAHSLRNDDSYDELKEDYLGKCVERLREYAPNITDGKVLGKYAYTPLDISRRLINMLEGGCRQGSYGYGQFYYGRPFPECSQYRTPIKRLYLCGSSCHPGGSIHFGPGYNAANVIAEDLKVKKWWPPYRPMGTSLVAS